MQSWHQSAVDQESCTWAHPAAVVLHHCSNVVEKVPSSGGVRGGMAWQGPWLAVGISGAGFMGQTGPGDTDASLRGKRETDQKVPFRAKWSPREQPGSLQAVTGISAQTLCQYLDRTYLWYLAAKPYCPQAGLVSERDSSSSCRNGCSKEWLWWHYSQELCCSQGVLDMMEA